MQARCLIQRFQLANRYDGHGPSVLFTLGECWVEDSDDIDVRYSNLAAVVRPLGTAMDFYTMSTDPDYKYVIHVY